MVSIDGEYEIESVLAKFPGPVEIHADTNKMTTALIGLVVFFGVCAFSLYLPWQFRSKTVAIFMMAVVVAYSVPAILRLMLMLKWRIPLVTLRADGVSLFTAGLSLGTGFRRRNLSWQEVKSIYFAPQYWSLKPKYVVVHYLDTGKRPKIFPYAALPYFHPGGAAQLVQLMTLWRERALAASNKNPSSNLLADFARRQTAEGTSQGGRAR